MKIGKVEAELLYGAGFTCKEIGRLGGFSKQRAHQLLAATLPRRPKGKPKRSEPDFAGLLKARIVREIAAILADWSIVRISSILYPGQDVAKTRLGRRRVKRIIANRGAQVVTLWNAGHSYPEIKRLLGVGGNYISATLARARLQGSPVRYARPSSAHRFSHKAQPVELPSHPSPPPGGDG